MPELTLRDRILVGSVYFVQGVVGITGMAEFLLTRNAFHFTWVQLAFLGALTTLTWCIKPLYGFLTDLLPLFGLRRKPYLYISSLLPIAGYLLLALLGTSFVSIALCSMLISVGLGFADVIIDGLVVESSTEDTVGPYQALCWRAKGWGILVASLFSGLLLERSVFSKALGHTALTTWLTAHFPATFTDIMVGQIHMLDIRYLLFFTSLWPLITLALTFSMKEAPAPPISNHALSQPTIISALIAFLATAIILFWGTSSKAILIPGIKNEALSSLGVVIIWSIWIGQYLKSLIRHKMATPTLLFAALFLFLWRFTPSFGAPWSNYYLNTLHLSPEKLGLISTLSSLSWIIGTWIYNHYLDKYKLSSLLFWTVLIGVFLSFTQLTLATAEWGFAIGATPLIKYPASILLFPIYLIVYQGHAWPELMAQPTILNLEALLSFFLEIMFMISFLPLLKLSAKVTPKGVEATNFSILASVMNLGLVFGSISGGWIYTYIEGTYHWGTLTFTGLHITIFIGAVTSLLCLPVLKRIREL